MFDLTKLKKMNKNPKVILKPTKADFVFEIFSIVALITLWYPIVIHYNSLPDTIPIHFDVYGVPDDYGDKSSLLLLPIIGTLSYVMLTVLNKFPHLFNFPSEITETNAHRMYGLATTMLRLIKLLTLLTLVFLIHLSIQTSLGQAKGLGSNFAILSSLGFIIPVIYYFIESSKINKKSTTSKAS